MGLSGCGLRQAAGYCQHDKVTCGSAQSVTRSNIENISLCKQLDVLYLGYATHVSGSCAHHQELLYCSAAIYKFKNLSLDLQAHSSQGTNC
jgi:hypothetical protein